MYREVSSIDLNWVEARAATYRAVRDLSEVHLSEWDLLVTDREIELREIPAELDVLRIVNIERTGEHYLAWQNGNGESPRTQFLEWVTDRPGQRMLRVDHLPESLQDLVQSQLVPAMDIRKYQDGIESPIDESALAPTITDIRPFLRGPEDLIMAMSYKFKGQGRHWVIPSDAGELYLWLDCALNEWSVASGRTYPAQSTWQVSPKWMTTRELGALGDVEETKRVLQETTSTLQAKLEAQLVTLKAIQREAEGGTKALLTGQGDALQLAVKEALESLGFEVQDMDDEWPADAKLEDYRIRDSEAPEWLAIGDATGTAKGAKLSKFSALQSHLSHYLISADAKAKTVPDLWLIVNQLIHRAPDLRDSLFRTDEAAVIASANGLAIDTTAIFVLVAAAETNPSLRPGVRTWMRGRRGQLTLTDAQEWLKAREDRTAR